MAENYAHKQDGSRSVSINELTKEELVQEVLRLRGQLKKKNSFGLVFERQTEDAILNRKSTIPVLAENKEKLVNNGGEDNLLLIGDNFDSLTCLLETHRGKIDIIYIDPPYNTGNEDFIYNDRYVNPEDSFRHSKWLSFMESRLLLAKELMSDKGVMFVSLDDNEQAHLNLLLGQVFGEQNVDTIIWHKVDENKGGISAAGKRYRREHEYVLIAYSNKYNTNFNKVMEKPNFKNLYTNPDNDPRGSYKAGNITSGHTEGGKNYYTVISPAGKEFSRQWHYSQQEFEELDKDGRIYWGKNGDAVPAIKIFINEPRPKFPTSIISGKGSATTASKMISSMLGEESFTYPKPHELMKHLIELVADKDSLIVDFFAGSGTTGHAVIELNKEDGGNRKFILCTNDEAGIGETVTYERIKRVITGKDWADGKEHESHEASLRYYNVKFIERDKSQSIITENVDGLINIAESCFNELYKGEMSSLWNNTHNHFTALLRDPWGVEELAQILSTHEPSTLSLYVHDNGADYSQELGEIESQGWDINYISLNDFIFNVINFVDEKLNINLSETNNEDSIIDIEYGDEIGGNNHSECVEYNADSEGAKDNEEETN